MKGAISSSGASVSGPVGGQKGSVGVGSNGTVSLGVDFGGAKLGVTNDYGGAGTIGFGGQSVTWGPEGGNIKLGVGGFDVIVEARDCVVVETKRIAGMIVSQRSYPDPGCKQPQQPQQPTLTPNSDGTKKPWEICYPINNSDGYTLLLIELTKMVSGRTQTEQLSPGDWSWTYGFEHTITYVWNNVIRIGTETTIAKRWDSHPRAGGADVDPTPIDETIVTIKQVAKVWSKHEGYARSDRFRGMYFIPPRPTGIPPLINGFRVAGWFGQEWEIVNAPDGCPKKDPTLPTPSPEPILILRISLPSAGNTPPMPESCCESLKADIEDIKSVLATKEMLAKNLTFPWRLRMPGGEGDEVITDYPNLARCIAQMIDHLGIHPPKLSIKDINNAIAGDQSINNQFPSATQGFEALMAQVWDANADVDTLTNFLYRLSWLCVQQSMNLAVVSSDIQCIKDMVGGRTKPGTATLVTPFNIGAGVNESSTKGKGFGKGSGGIDQKIDVNTELSTESLLPNFLKIRENPVVIETFDGDKDVVDMLSMLILKVETLLAR